MSTRALRRRRRDDEPDRPDDERRPPPPPEVDPLLVADERAGRRGSGALAAQAAIGLQRTAGNASLGRVLARRAQIDLDGWGSPLFGDDDSDVTFTPEGEYTTGGMEDQLSQLPEDADPLAVFMMKQMGVKGGQYSSTGMQEQGGYQGALKIKAGTKGTVKLLVFAHFFFDEKINNTYDTEFSCSWTVEADLKGKLKISKARPDFTAIKSDEAPFQLQGLNADQDPDMGTVQISPQFVSYQFTDIPNVTIGGNIDLGEEGKGRRGGFSGGVTLGNEQTFPPGMLVRTFMLRLEVTDIPPPPEPTVEIGPITYSLHRGHEVIFEKPKQDRVSGKQEAELLKFYMSLSEETRKGLREGNITMKADGYASTTDKATNNRELARRRVDGVMKILRDFGAKKFDDAALGEYEAMEDDPKKEVEAQENRKVVLELDEAPVTIEAPTAGP